MFSKGESTMLKKVVIAGLALAVGVAVLGWVSPKMCSLMHYYSHQAQESFESAIPPETEIGRLKNELNELKMEKPRYFDKVAVEEVSFKKLEKEIDADAVALKSFESEVDALASRLESNRTATKVSLNGNSVKREDAVVRLNSAVELRDAKRAELSQKRELLEQNRNILEEDYKQLATYDSTITGLETRLAAASLKIKTARAAASKSTVLQTDSDRLSRASADINKLDENADILQHKADLARKYNSALPIRPTEKVSEEDVLKRARGNVQVEDKPVLAEQK
jgi:predicted  nucleic acid-binding Zn-ribbon protein